MLHVGQQSAFPKLKFLANRLKVERRIERGRRETRPSIRRGSIESILSEDDMARLILREGATDEETEGSVTGHEDEFENAVDIEDSAEEDVYEELYEDHDGDGDGDHEEALERQIRGEATKVD